MSETFNPFLHPPTAHFDLDEHSQALLKKTISFFENKGKKSLKHDDIERIWYQDFLDFIKEEHIFATLLTPQKYGSEDARWDTYRISLFNEILGFYGLSYWYTWQVTILGLGPIWMSKNEGIKQRTAQLLRDGGVFAFGLSEKEHGADLYASEMCLEQTEAGQYIANGRKYYIGNGNCAALVSTFGKVEDDFVFFVSETQHPNYHCLGNLINSQNYIAELELKDYPVKEEDILSRGREAWDTALNTVNVGKFNLGFAAIGLCTHAFYESLNHAANRQLFDHYVTDFVHIKQLFMDAYCRLLAMKAFSTRSVDYFRSASAEDRRYLLYNSLVKMKVTTEAEHVINALWDVIAAKGFIKDTFFSMAAVQVRGLPKLEGTVHVNMALIMKFMQNYFFKPQAFPPVPRRHDASDDVFLFQQGSSKGMGHFCFHDYRPIYKSYNTPNVRRFYQQTKIFKQMLMLARPSKEQIKDFDFLLIVGELFSLVVYGQLILENALALEKDLIEQIFDFMIRDFSKFAMQLYCKSNSTRAQRVFCKRMLRKPVTNVWRYEKVWRKYVYALKDHYQMQA